MKVLLNVNCYKRIIYNIDENINIMLYDAAYIINNIIVLHATHNVRLLEIIKHVVNKL